MLISKINIATNYMKLICQYLTEDKVRSYALLQKLYTVEEVEKLGIRPFYHWMNGLNHVEDFVTRSTPSRPNSSATDEISLNEGNNVHDDSVPSPAFRPKVVRKDHSHGPTAPVQDREEAPIMENTSTSTSSSFGSDSSASDMDSASSSGLDA